MSVQCEDESEIDGMSIKQLRSLIKSAGLSFADCFEKSELRSRAREAFARLKEAEARKAAGAGGPSGSGSGVERRQGKRTFGGYECLTDGPADPDLVVVFLHGYGATADDFVDVPVALKSSPKWATRKPPYFVFPQAPAGASGATEWWKLDVMKWMGAMQQGQQGIARLIRDAPEGIGEFRTKMTALVDEVKAHAGVDYSRIVLGGFSQGAMSAMDVALSMPAAKRVAGVTMVSGAPIVIERWTERLRVHRGLRVFVSHGRSDMVLPFAASGWTRQVLEGGGAEVRYETHGEGHTLGPPNILMAICEFWASVGGA